MTYITGGKDLLTQNNKRISMALLGFCDSAY